MLDQEEIEEQIIPEQVLASDQAVLSSFGTAFQASSQTVAAGGLVASLAMGVSLKFFWKMLGAIQLMVHFPFFAIGFPSNAKYLFSFVIDLANMNIIPTDKIIDKITGLKSVSMSSDLGYSSNVFSSLGMVLFVLVVAVFLGLFVLIVRLVFKRTSMLR